MNIRSQVFVGSALAVALLAGCTESSADRPLPRGGGVNPPADVDGNGGQGSETSAACGNGIAEGTEDCDGGALDGASCSDLGFDEGQLECNSACQFDTSACGGSENCTDGRDNDGDGQVDCADSDCSYICTNACARPPALPDPANVAGDLTGHGSLSTASCASGHSEDGGEITYRFVAQNTGMLDVEVMSDDNVTVSLRTFCANSGTESQCANEAGGQGSLERLSAPVVAGETWFIVVEGYSDVDDGAFALMARSRAIACGDGHRDADESCDDANLISGDGCSASCTLESDELEPNDVWSEANPLTQPFLGSVEPAGDEDWVIVSLSAGQTSLVIETLDFDGACAGWIADSQVELYDADGAVLLGSDDDSGAGSCARLDVGGLSAGQYRVRVIASDEADLPTFNYSLSVTAS